VNKRVIKIDWIYHKVSRLKLFDTAGRRVPVIAGEQMSLYSACDSRNLP